MIIQACTMRNSRYWKTAVSYESQKVNDKLLEHLASTFRWLLYYSETNNIDLSDKDKIIDALDRAMIVVSKLPRSANTTTHFSSPKHDTHEDDKT